MFSPNQDQDPPYSNPYLSTLTFPTPESLPGSQYPYMAQYYANTHNPNNAMQAPSPYSTPYSTTTTNYEPTLYDRYRDSGMINQMGPILLSLICSRYQDLPSKSNPLLAIRLYVKQILISDGALLHNSVLTNCLLEPVSVVQRLEHHSSLAPCHCSTFKRPECGGCSSRRPNWA